MSDIQSTSLTERARLASFLGFAATKTRMKSLTLFLAVLSHFFSLAHAETNQPDNFLDWAPTPPMGWNSWDNFATTVTEAQTKAQADVIKNHALGRWGPYSQLDREDPRRVAFIDGVALRTALNLAVVGSGVTDLVIGAGVIIGRLDRVEAIPL